MIDIWYKFLNGPQEVSPVISSSVHSVLYFTRDVIWLVLLTFPHLIIFLFEYFFPGELQNVEGNIVLITGTGRGMGREYAKQFSALGSTVVCVDINEANNKTTVDEINSSRGHKDAAVSYICDVGDPDAVRRLSKEVLAKFGHVDILVSNAAILCGHNITGGDDSFIQRIMNVNLMSSFWMIRSFLPHMKQRNKGHFVFMNSTIAFHGVCNASTYSASKSGLYGMSSSLRQELFNDPSITGIKITDIFSGFVGTYDFKRISMLTSRVPTIEPEVAVEEMIKGIRLGVESFTVPGGRFFLFLIYCSRLFSSRYYRILRKVFYFSLNVTEEAKIVVAPYMYDQNNAEAKHTSATL